MLFDLNHTLYIVISLILTVGLLFLFSRFRTSWAKDRILKAVGILTVVIHVSSIFHHGQRAGVSEYPLPDLFLQLHDVLPAPVRGHPQKGERGV